METLHSEEQIIGILKEPNAGILAREVGRKHRNSQDTLCRWQAKFGGTDINKAAFGSWQDENEKRMEPVV